MNYKRIHDSIIEKRRILGIPVGYSEIHHIIPKSFGGDNSRDNLIRLTAKEHFVIHRLLAKMYPNTGMVHAVYKMACINLTENRIKISSRTYKILRENHAERVRNDTKAARKKSETLKGKKQSKEHALKRAESRKSNNPDWITEDTKRKIGEANKGKDGTWKGKTLPPELVEKRNASRHANGNYSWPEERKKIVSEKQRGRKLGPKLEEQKAKLRKIYIVNGDTVVDNAKEYCALNGLRYQKFISAANSGNPYKGLNISKQETS